MKESTVLFHHQTNPNCSVLHLLKFNVSKRNVEAVQKVVVQLKNQNRILSLISENVTFENRTMAFSSSENLIRIEQCGLAVNAINCFGQSDH